MNSRIKYLAIDSSLGRNESDLARLERILSDTKLKGLETLLLLFSKPGNHVRGILDSYSIPQILLM